MPTAVQFSKTVADIDAEIYQKIKLVETGNSSALSATALAIHDDGANIPTIGAV